MIVAVISKKGGVGKTTTSVSLASALATRGRRVLLVDLDPQASSSLSLGIPRSRLGPSIADVLLSGMPAVEAIRRNIEPGLDLLTSSTDLLDADYSMASLRRREQVLRDRLEPVADSYDYVLIDCAPALTTLPANAIVASDVFVVPTTAQYLSTEGVSNLVQRAERIAERNQSKSRLLGILLTMVDYRSRATRDHVDSLRECFNDAVFAIEIRVNVRLAEAPEHGCSIFQHDGRSTGAKAYGLLADEFLMRAQDELATAAALSMPADELTVAQPETGQPSPMPAEQPSDLGDTVVAQAGPSAPSGIKPAGQAPPTETVADLELTDTHHGTEPDGEGVHVGWHHLPLTTN